MKTAWGLGKHGVVDPVKIVQHLIRVYDWSYMIARAESNKHVKYVKPYTAPLDVLTFDILTIEILFRKRAG